ncbi:MAG: helix-turn-helix domain-containing protein [Thermoleophilia bacterium]|nr:helix-turn-helix domain-containing protein [Thermoleophilia bacterium]MDH3725733.1 helix-turn-helix domain-containing protein [Thermoleophilia bacterium]
MTTTHLPSEITVSEAAERLGVSERTVWRYLKSDRLTGHTVGEAGSQRTLIDPDSVMRIASERGRDPQAAALRAERDRLASELEQIEAERDALRGRVNLLQRAANRPSNSIVERITGLVFLAISRIPSRSRSLPAQ